MPGLVDGTAAMPESSPQRLILCFDGTSNSFQGTPADTNVVKLYYMFDRKHPQQLHYYQPGIGTYPAEGPVNVNPFKAFVRKIAMILDQALATSFDSHVIAGYRFLMRYYRPGDKIYMFGFSRGAFTARFLARMISHVGLLSMGNEEMVPFAYKVYQDYERNLGSDKDNRAQLFMRSFKEHFCRMGPDEEIYGPNQSGIKVHFLGLFDCVSSVRNLDFPLLHRAPPLPAAHGTAKHVRHAVSIDERRVKFKAALFAQEPVNPYEDIKEVWFPGSHADIGGGWSDKKQEKAMNSVAHFDRSHDYFQQSDIALKWMIDEIDQVDSLTDDGQSVAWNAANKQDYLDRFEANKGPMLSATLHDVMSFSGENNSFFGVLLWNWMDSIPFLIKRWEFTETSYGSKKWSWQYIGWPANMGGRRDIPSRAIFHTSVLLRLALSANSVAKRGRYKPGNFMWYFNGNPLKQARQEALTIQNGEGGGNVGGHFIDETKISEAKLSDLARNFSRADGEAKLVFVDAKDGQEASTDIDELRKTWDRVYRVGLRDSVSS